MGGKHFVGLEGGMEGSEWEEREIDGGTTNRIELAYEVTTRE